jgi:hypothetical protein
MKKFEQFISEEYTPKTHDDFYPEINVWFTKTFKLRAKIKESRESIPFEVTIGGDSWNSGKGRKFENIIMKKIINLQKRLNEEIEKLK